MQKYYINGQLNMRSVFSFNLTDNLASDIKIITGMQDFYRLSIPNNCFYLLLGTWIFKKLHLAVLSSYAFFIIKNPHIFER